MIFQQCLIDSFSVPAKNFPLSLSLTPHLPSARVSYRSSNRVLSPSPFFYFLFLAHFSSSFSQFVFPTHLSSPFTQAICLVIVAAVVVIVGAVVVLVVVLVAVPVIHTFTGRSTVYPNNSFYWIRSGGSVFLIHFLDSLVLCIGLGALFCLLTRPSARYVFRCTHTHTPVCRFQSIGWTAAGRCPIISVCSRVPTTRRSPVVSSSGKYASGVC